MIELLALLALLVGPVLVVVPCRRLARRARAAGVTGPQLRRERSMWIRDGEGLTVALGLTLIIVALLVLMVSAVLQ